MIDLHYSSICLVETTCDWKGCCSSDTLIGECLEIEYFPIVNPNGQINYLFWCCDEGAGPENQEAGSSRSPLGWKPAGWPWVNHCLTAQPTLQNIVGKIGTGSIRYVHCLEITIHLGWCYLNIYTHTKPLLCHRVTLLSTYKSCRPTLQGSLYIVDAFLIKKYIMQYGWTYKIYGYVLVLKSG